MVKSVTFFLIITLTLSLRLNPLHPPNDYNPTLHDMVYVDLIDIAEEEISSVCDSLTNLSRFGTSESYNESAQWLYNRWRAYGLQTDLVYFPFETRIPFNTSITTFTPIIRTINASPWVYAVSDSRIYTTCDEGTVRSNLTYIHNRTSIPQSDPFIGLVHYTRAFHPTDDDLLFHSIIYSPLCQAIICIMPNDSDGVESAQVVYGEWGVPIVGIESNDGYWLCEILSNNSVEIEVTLERKDRTIHVPNVIARKEGEGADDRILVLSAHLDTFSDFHDYAWGSDDDGSGITIIDNLARRFAELEVNRTIIFAAWGLEELGLLGSKWWIDNHVSEGARKGNIILNLNIDMVGYGNSSVLITNTESQVFSELFIEYLSDNGVPDFTLLFSDASISDHVNFWDTGIPALTIFEGFTSINPFYHTPLDQVQYLNLTLITGIANAVLDFIYWLSNPVTTLYVTTSLVLGDLGGLKLLITVTNTGHSLETGMLLWIFIEQSDYIMTHSGGSLGKGESVVVGFNIPPDQLLSGLTWIRINVLGLGASYSRFDIIIPAITYFISLATGGIIVIVLLIVMMLYKKQVTRYA